VRVADFSVHAAGPFAGLMLAELGAQVIKIESAARLDITRRPHSMYGKPPSSFEQVNANKLSACLNLKEPRAVDLALELVRISDLVLENFRPGVMDRLGLGYPQLRRVKPDVILVSLCSNGQTGPESGYAGYAPMFAALGGLGHLTGYPDGPPVELRHAMDHTGGVLAAFCAVAALCARKSPYSPFTKGGQSESPLSQRGVRDDSSEGGSFLGQHVDVSVRDLATAFIGPALLDYAMNRREAHRRGNRDEASAPQGVYRCQGEDAWVSISVASEEEWQGLLRALGHPKWAEEPKFGDAYQRWLNQDDLDRKLEDWSLGFTPQEVTERLQEEGVAAFPSLAANQLMADPHLRARDAFPIVEHPEKGRQRAVSPPWRFSRTPARLDRWTPSLGEDNVEVFHGLLGLSVAEVKALEETRVIW
jgi:benzylsuccinate CoA-transferase BbsF subunit